VGALIKYGRYYNYDDPYVQQIQFEYEAYQEEKHDLEIQTEYIMLGNNMDAKKEALQQYSAFVTGQSISETNSAALPDKETLERDMQHILGGS
jgi:hypothetical protein